jgi:hypothetical protein
VPDSILVDGDVTVANSTWLPAIHAAFRPTEINSAMTVHGTSSTPHPVADHVAFAPWVLQAEGINNAFIGNPDAKDAVIPYSGAWMYRPSEVPIPAAAWLFGSALLGLGVIKRKKA